MGAFEELASAAAALRALMSKKLAIADDEMGWYVDGDGCSNLSWSRTRDAQRGRTLSCDADSSHHLWRSEIGDSSSSDFLLRWKVTGTTNNIRHRDTR